jgi:hypothetical protein
MTDDLVTAYLYRKDGRQYVQPGRDPSAAKWGWTETALVPATELTALRARLVEVEAALNMIADFPVKERASAVTAMMLQQVAAKVLGRPTVSQEAFDIVSNALGGTDGQ